MRCLTVCMPDGKWVELPLEYISEIHLNSDEDKRDSVVTTSGDRFEIVSKGLYVEDYYSVRDVFEMQCKKEDMLSERAKELGVSKDDLRPHICFMTGSHIFQR